MLPLFGASYHAESTPSISPPSRKQGSITPLTSAAISHLDTRVIQLAALTLLACLPLLWLLDANPLTLHSSNFLWAAGLVCRGILAEVRLIGLILNQPGPFQRVCSSCCINLLVNWCWTLYQRGGGRRWGGYNCLRERPGSKKEARRSHLPHSLSNLCSTNILPLFASTFFSYSVKAKRVLWTDTCSIQHQTSTILVITVVIMTEISRLMKALPQCLGLSFLVVEIMNDSIFLNNYKPHNSNISKELLYKKAKKLHHLLQNT